jgi:hypothetical protein
VATSLKLSDAAIRLLGGSIAQADPTVIEKARRENADGLEQSATRLSSSAERP